MKEFNLVFKYALSQIGVKEVKLRSGQFKLAVAPLEPILPFLAVYINIAARLACAREVIECELSLSRSSHQLAFINDPVIINNDLFSAVVVSLKEQTIVMDGVADFTRIEDSMASFIDSQETQSPLEYDDVVNQMMMSEYSKLINTVGRPLSLALALENEESFNHGY